MARTLLKINLEVIRGTTQPLRSDTLFGLLCWAIVDRLGEATLAELIDSCAGSDPGIVFSDAFPGDSLPRPDFPFLRPIRGQPSREQQLKSAKEAKKLRDLRYLPSDLVKEILKGNEPNLRGVDGGRFATFVTEHVTMDRRYNRALEGALFSLREIRPSAGYLTFYTSVTDEWRAVFDQVFSYMVEHGIGGSRTIGRGRFRIKSIDPDTSFWDVVEPNAFMSLSTLVPARTDPVEGWYRIGVKRGAAAQRLGCSTPFKRVFLYFEAGATFRTIGRPKPVYGRLIRNVVQSDPRVVQSGLAVAVPVRLPDHLTNTAADTALSST